ncbi:HNH endonuclease signature motif containing protein [Parafrankia sp. BMG5.11]|uniref:HNH endonuclease signature motif containing protein n=1 Tax=Parafrankia sp. BMG5.11 TaxID=222540 RepID=UPI001A9E8942|nr:HNH endonuclease signature motif containing protein [Parafrankia sp. BMG5.11]
MTAWARFAAKVSKVPHPNGCHMWIGSLTSTGYGKFRDENGRLVMAHRWIWEYARGPIPDGMVIDHFAGRCRRRDCVRLSHLAVVTPGENNRRGWAIRRFRQAQQLRPASPLRRP